ncbi:MAG: hypothetical protein GX137_02215, partial [Thermoplasmatales archaeon]|nr:hypothetical protein [Thermoplasmatales archaeon]
VQGGKCSTEGDSGPPLFAINRSRDPFVAREIEKYGIRVFNSSIVNLFANDKYATYILAKNLDVPVAETKILGNDPVLRFPCIVKRRSGHGGSEVFRINDDNELKDSLGSADRDGFIIQPVVTETGEDLRVYMIGGEIIAGVKRAGRPGDCRSNYSLGGTAELTEVPEEVRDMAARIQKELGSDFIGLDFMITDGSYILNEIEDPVGSRMLYDVSDTDIIDLYAQYVYDNYQQESAGEALPSPFIDDLSRWGGIKNRVSKMIVDNSLPASTPINSVGMNRRTANYIGVVHNEELLIHCNRTGKGAQVRTTIIEQNDDFILSLKRDTFSSYLCDENNRTLELICSLIPFEQIRVSKIVPQPVNNIDQSTIYVSGSIYDKISEIDSKFFALRHLTYGYTLIIRKKDIKQGSHLKDGRVSLSKYQRILLGADGSLHMAVDHLENLDSPGEDAGEDASWLRAVLYEGREFSERHSVSECLSKYDINKYVLFPLFLSKEDHLGEGALTRISNFFIGNSEIMLRSCRPYNSDEGSRIIRMSCENMKMIGIDESDQIILETGYSSVKVRAFSFENEDLARETNNIGRIFDNQSIVGIPVNIRREINLSDIGSTVRVKRDTTFVLKKNLNIQLISLVLLFISFFQVATTMFEPLAATGLSLLFIICGYPLILYFVLSRERCRTRQR